MKVLMVNKFLHPAGGAETYVFQLGKWLEDQGHEVWYFGMDHPDRIVGNPMDLYTESIDFHTSSIVKRFTYLPHIIRSEDARKKMLLILKKFRPDVIHINNFNYQLTPTILEACAAYKKHRPKAKIIFTAHDAQLVCPNHMLYNPGTDQRCDKCVGGHSLHCVLGKCIHGSFLRSFLGTMESIYWSRKRIYGAFDRIICPSAFMKSMLDTNPLLKDKTTVLLNYIHEMEEPTVTVNKEEPYVLFFGRLSVEKGIEPLMKACQATPKVRYKVAGSGPYADEISKLSNVDYVGFQTGLDLINLIKGASFTVCPSVWYENCPFSVLESIKLGTPVIGSRVGGIPELIDDGRTGLLVEAGDSQALADQITYLWNQEEVLEEMRKELEAVHFDDLEQYGVKLLHIYQEG